MDALDGNAVWRRFQQENGNTPDQETDVEIPEITRDDIAALSRGLPTFGGENPKQAFDLAAYNLTQARTLSEDAGQAKEDAAVAVIAAFAALDAPDDSARDDALSAFELLSISSARAACDTVREALAVFLPQSRRSIEWHTRAVLALEDMVDWGVSWSGSLAVARWQLAQCAADSGDLTRALEVLTYLVAEHDVCHKFEPRAAKLRSQVEQAAAWLADEMDEHNKIARELQHAMRRAEEVDGTWLDRGYSHLAADLQARLSTAAIARGDLAEAGSRLENAHRTGGLDQRETAMVLHQLISETRLQCGDDAADQLLKNAPRRFGVIAAGLAGHESSRRLAEIELGTHSLDALTDESGRHKAVPPAKPPSEYLCDLLNADSRLIQMRAQEPEQVRRGDVPGSKYWREVCLLQHTARMLYGRRRELEGINWAEVFRSSQSNTTESQNLRSTWYDGRCFLLVSVDAYREDSEVCIDGVSIADRIRELRELTDHIEQRHSNRGNESLFHWELRFRFSPCDHHLLEQILGVGSSVVSCYSVDRTSSQNTLPAAPRRNAPNLDFKEDLTAITEQRTYSRAARRLQCVVRMAWRALLGAVFGDEPRLRYCQMPRGWKTWADYHLIQREDDVEKCNTFYLLTRQEAATCGEERCKKASRPGTFEKALKMRAEQLARQKARKRLDKRKASDYFDCAWQKASEEGDGDPYKALDAFDSVLTKMIFPS